MSRLRALLVAEAANPEWVSVPLVGWSLAAALSQVANTHLVTQVRNRDAVLRAGLEEGRDFSVIDTEALDGPLWRLASKMSGNKGAWTLKTAINSLTYRYFESLVWRKFGAGIQSGRYDIVHRITPLTPTAPSPLARRCAVAGVPFVLGPLNGGVPWPKGFDRERRREREWLSYVRAAYKWLPGHRSTLQYSAALMLGSLHTLSEIPPRYRGKCIYLPENAVDPARFSTPAPAFSGGPLRAIFVGRLVPYKGPDMALEAALPLIEAGRMEFDFVGDGPLMPALVRFVEQHNLQGRVRLHGWVEHGRVQDHLRAAHVLAFPSVREFGGGVVLEAMALGVVPLIVDYAGPGELVDRTTGFKVPIGSRADIVRGLGQQLASLVERPEVLQPMADAGRDRVRRLFTWRAKAAQVLDVYNWAIDTSSAQPVPFPVAVHPA
jgi:glycogen synthase